MNCDPSGKGVQGVVDIQMSSPDPSSHGNVYSADKSFPGYENTNPWAACDPTARAPNQYSKSGNYCHGNTLLYYKIDSVRPGDTYVANLAITPGGVHASDPQCPSQCATGTYSKIGEIADCGSDSEYSAETQAPLETGVTYLGKCAGRRAVCIVKDIMN